MSGIKRIRPRFSAEPWGLQALLQLLVFLIIGVLLWDALNELRTPAKIPKSWLLRVNEHISTGLLPRINKALEPEYQLDIFHLSNGVAAWALVSVIGNMASALVLFFIAALSVRERHFFKSIIVVISTASVFLSLIVIPFLYAVLKSNVGDTVPFDVAIVSLLIYLAYLSVDFLFCVDGSDVLARNNFLVFMAAVDLPCVLTTVIFIACNLYVNIAPDFAVGVAVGLLIYYSLAYLLLCSLFWWQTKSWEARMNTLQGNVLLAIAVGAALNGVIGFLVQLVKLPIYLDLVGSIFVGLICGPIPGIFAAILGSVLLGVITTPINIAYVGTAVVVTVVATYLKRLNYGTNIRHTVVLGGFVLGPLSSIFSIPITTYLFSGVTFSGSDIVTALFLNTMGTTLLTSVAAGAFIFDAIDKALASVLVYYLYRSAPRRLLNQTP